MSETRPEGYCKDCRVEPADLKPDGSLASRCAACAAKRRRIKREARAAALAIGRCAWESNACERKAINGLTYCLEHLEYHRARRAAEYQKKKGQRQ